MPPTVPQDRKPAKRTTRKTAAKAVAAPPVSPDQKYAPTTWGSPGAAVEDLVTPSGQLCQVRRPGVEGLMKAGVLNDIDSLSSIVGGNVRTATGQPPMDAASIAANPEALENILHLTDRVVCYVVIQPPIQMTPNDPTSRKDGVIYADQVDLEDKMFILNYAVGGTRDLERFRRELQQHASGVVPQQAAEGSPE